MDFQNLGDSKKLAESITMTLYSSAGAKIIFWRIGYISETTRNDAKKDFYSKYDNILLEAQIHILKNF